MEPCRTGIQEGTRSHSSVTPCNRNSVLSRDSCIPEPCSGTNLSGFCYSQSQRRQNPAVTVNADIGVAPDSCVTAPGVCDRNEGLNTKEWLLARKKSQSSAYSKSKSLEICAKCRTEIANEFVSAFGDIYHPQCFTCYDCQKVLSHEFFPVNEKNGPVPLCETDVFRRLDMLCSKCGGALRDLYISAIGRKYHMNHFTCHSCQKIIGSGDNYYVHRGQAYCKDDYSAKYADPCDSCGMPVMDQYIKDYSPKKRVWHDRCYKTHKRHNPDSSLAELPLLDDHDTEPSTSEEEKILNKFEEMVMSLIGDSLGHLESGSREEISDGILALITAVGVLFSSIDIVDDSRRKAGKPPLSDSPEIDLLRAKLTDFMTVSLSRSQQRTRSMSSHLKGIYAASSGLSYFIKRVIKILGENVLNNDPSGTLDEYLNSLDQFPEDLPSTAMVFSESELNRDDAELCLACNVPIRMECVSWGGYLRRQHLTCKSSCVHCDTCDTPENLYRVLISTPGDSYALCCTSCQDISISGYTNPDSVIPCTYITKLQQYIFLLKVQFKRLGNSPDASYDYIQTATATRTTPPLEKPSKPLDKGIFGRLSSNSDLIAEEQKTNNIRDRTAADTFAIGSKIGSSYQGLRKGFFGRSRTNKSHIRRITAEKIMQTLH
ncbi:hypothetical protein PABG_06512 [Paracoccidioides brasiliensis Pb03]|nr:hypothetical protein PABG_06512 [Paracoccidioides brasiliensis Pb03]